MYILTANQKKKETNISTDFPSESVSLTDFRMDKEENMWMFAVETPLQYNTSQLENVWSRVQVSHL